MTLDNLDDLLPNIEFIVDKDVIKMRPSQYFKYSTNPTVVNAYCLTLTSIYAYDNIILGIDFMANNRF